MGLLEGVPGPGFSLGRLDRVVAMKLLPLLQMLFVTSIAIGASAAGVNGTNVVVWVSGGSNAPPPSCFLAGEGCGTVDSPCHSIMEVVNSLRPCLCSSGLYDPCIASVELMLTGDVDLPSVVSLPNAHWALVGMDATPTVLPTAISMYECDRRFGSLAMTNLAVTMHFDDMQWSCDTVATDCSFSVGHRAKDGYAMIYSRIGNLFAIRCSFSSPGAILDIRRAGEVSLIDCSFSDSQNVWAVTIAADLVTIENPTATNCTGSTIFKAVAGQVSMSNFHFDERAPWNDSWNDVLVHLSAHDSVFLTNCSVTGAARETLFFVDSPVTVVDGMCFDSISNNVLFAGLFIEGIVGSASWALVQHLSCTDCFWGTGALLRTRTDALHITDLSIHGSSQFLSLLDMTAVTVFAETLLVDPNVCGPITLKAMALFGRHWILPASSTFVLSKQSSPTGATGNVELILDDLTTTSFGHHCVIDVGGDSVEGDLHVFNSTVRTEIFAQLFVDTSVVRPGFNATFVNCHLIDPVMSVSNHFLRLQNCTIVASKITSWSFRMRLATAVFENCTFNGNVATASRENIAELSPFALESSMATVSNCTFVNLSGKRGGVFYVTSESYLAVVDSSFSVATADDGGALWCSDSTLDFNSVRVRGGTSPAGGGFVLHSCTAHFEGLFVRESHASAGAGGALQVTGNSKVSLANSVFAQCTALRGGALSFIDASIAVLDGVEIRDCSAAGGGGALFFGDKSTTVIRDSRLLYNSAASFGGAAYATSYSEVLFDGCSFFGCTTSSLGGALFVQDFASVDVAQSHFAYNYAASSAGAVAYAGGSYGTLQDTLFECNSADSKGGAFDIANSASPEFLRATFFNNTSSVGGAISLNNYAHISVEECIFLNNSATSHGGGISLGDASTLRIEYSEFYWNTATGGGAIFSNRDTEVFVDNANFTSNNAYFGGAFFASSFQVTSISNSRFCLNSATRGGALSFAPAIQPVVSAYLEDTLFLENSANEGGALSLNDWAVVIMNDTLLTQNTATRKGGAAQVAGVSALNVNDCIVTDNHALFEGGGFSLTDSSRIVLYRVDMRSNTAALYGGAICAQLGPEVVVDHGAFYDNEALKGGACFIHVTNDTSISYVRFRDTLFRNNTAYASGGGVALQHRSIIAFQKPRQRPSDVPVGGAQELPAFLDCDFIGNQAVNGGAVVTSQAFASSRTLLVSILMHGNTASQLGGAVFVPHPGVDAPLFYGASLVNNVAGWGGSNIGWVEFSDALDEDICDGNCNITEGTQPYGTTMGAATAPSMGTFITDCPNTLRLDSPSFNVSVAVTDDFGTLVKGPVVTSNSISVLATVAEDSGCSFTHPANAAVDALTGTASLALELRGRQETECVVNFEFTTDMYLPIAPNKCVVLLQNCTNPDMEVVEEKEFDTCAFVEKKLPAATITLVILVVVLFVAVCLVYGVLFIGWQRRRQRKARTTVANLEFEDVLKLGWSIDALLSNTTIRNIPFDCLLFHDRIGVGASGIVHRAELFPDFPDGDYGVAEEPSEVAVKELRLPTTLIGEDAMQDFVNEIQLLNALEHENIVKFVGISYDGRRDTLFLVTELMHQGSLADVIRKKGYHLSRSLKIKMAVEAAAGMKYLHGCNVVHRDLKTQNLLVNSDWQCKVSDFGISTVKNQTMTTTCIGTPLYMAPEVLQHSRYSEKADIYSFGIVLVELFTGKAAYASLNEAGVSDGQIIFKVVVEGYRPELDCLPNSLQELVGECLHNKPALRPSFEEVHRRLTRLQSKALQAIPY